jgi:hypothetical protein
MILSLAIIINVTLALALLAGLAYAMSRPTLLTPHLATTEQPPVQQTVRTGRPSHARHPAPRPVLATVRA